MVYVKMVNSEMGVLLPLQEVCTPSLDIDQRHPGRSILKVALLANEWGSSKGGLSTINRTLAIHLAKHANVEVTILVPEFECGEEDKRTARGLNIAIKEVQRLPGFSDPLDWLSFPPKDLDIQVLVGHGAKLGRQAELSESLIVASGSRLCTLNLKSWQCIRTMLTPLPKVKEKTGLKLTCAKLQISSWQLDRS